ncbi:beta strand repeat-containing protein, partial [Belnapia rosea]|uniref:beta strand repeat-containing protein n=1 Tax=Belnapia rosea TaxID=938405 RepID=UPI0008916DF6
AGLDVRNLVAAARINATTVTATAGHVVNAGGARIVNGTVQVAPPGFELATLPGPLTAATAGALALVVSPAGGATASAAPGVPTTTGGMPSLTVTAGDTVSNAGVILAHRDLGVTAGRSIRNTAGASLLAETGRLTITATAGAIDMTSSSAGAGEAVAFRAGGAVTVTTAAIDAAVDQSILSGGSFTVTGSSLTAGRDLSVDVGGELRLESTALQASRDLSAVTRLGGISLADSTLTAGGTLGLTASGAIGQTRGMINAAAGTAIQAGSGITITGAGGAAPVLRSTGGGITLTADSGDIALSNAGLSAASALAVQAIQGDVTIGSSSLSSDGSGSIAAGGAVNLASTIVRAMADQSIMAGGGFAAAGSSLAAGRDLTIGAGTGFGLTSSGLKAGRNLSITTRLGNAATTDGAFLAGGTLAVTAAGGAVTQTRGSITGAGDASLRGGTDVTVTDAGSGIQPALRSTGGALTVVAGSGAVSLRNARLDGATGLGLAAGQGIGLTDTALTTTGRLAAAAGSGSLAVLRGVLTSTAGDIDLTAGGTGAITASALHAPSASGSVRVVTTGGLALSTLTVSADAADFEAGRIAPTDARTYGATNGASALTVTDGVTASIGSKILFAGPVGVSGIGPILVTPRGTPLPAVLFDTRIAPGSNPLSIVQPDTAGVIASQQPTQVRSAPGAQSPGAFGLPNQSIAAGTANINVNAGQSPVFLLVDGGTVLGTITAGRLAIHGTGGGMTLFGTLNGSVGAEAARFADITRPIEANSLQRYRINACVVSSINCVVPPSIQIIPPRPSDRAQFSVENNRITADVLIPNVAEEIEQ